MDKVRFLTCAVVLALAAVVLIPSSASAHGDLPEEGRWVDAGPWNGVLACESSPTERNGGHIVSDRNSKRYRAEVRVDQRGTGTDKGAFQIINSTWNLIARGRNQPQLLNRDPRSFTLARQFKQAQWLRLNEGIRQWTCWYRYGDGTGPRYITGEDHMPIKPRVCAKRLDKHHGVSKRIAKSICGVS